MILILTLAFLGAMLLAFSWHQFRQPPNLPERLRAAGEEAAQRVLEAAAGEVAKAETARRHSVQAAYAAGGLLLVGLAVAGGLLAAGL